MSETEIDFPYYRKAGAKNIPVKRSETYALFERTLRHFVNPFPAREFKTGDLLLTPETNVKWLDVYL